MHLMHLSILILDANYLFICMDITFQKENIYIIYINLKIFSHHTHVSSSNKIGKRICHCKADRGAFHRIWKMQVKIICLQNFQLLLL